MSHGADGLTQYVSCAGRQRSLSQPPADGGIGPDFRHECPVVCHMNGADWGKGYLDILPAPQFCTFNQMSDWFDMLLDIVTEVLFAPILWYQCLQRVQVNL